MPRRRGQTRRHTRAAARAATAPRETVLAAAADMVVTVPAATDLAETVLVATVMVVTVLAVTVMVVTVLVVTVLGATALAEIVLVVIAPAAAMAATARIVGWASVVAMIRHATATRAAGARQLRARALSRGTAAARSARSLIL